MQKLFFTKKNHFSLNPSINDPLQYWDPKIAPIQTVFRIKGKVRLGILGWGLKKILLKKATETVLTLSFWLFFPVTFFFFFFPYLDSDVILSKFFFMDYFLVWYLIINKLLLSVSSYKTFQNICIAYMKFTLQIYALYILFLRNH